MLVSSVPFLSRSLAAAFQIRAIPTLMIVRDGVMLGANPGALGATALDELIANLTISKCKTALGGREIVVFIPAVSSYAADRAARLCRLVGGSVYTGTAKHFVKYRDDRSPFGYDAVDIGAMPPQADFMVHGDEFAQAYIREGDLPFAKLLFRLSIRKLPGGDHLDVEDRGDLHLGPIRAEHGARGELLKEPCGERGDLRAGESDARAAQRLFRVRRKSLTSEQATPRPSPATAHLPLPGL